MEFSSLMQAVVNGLLLGGIYALLAAGLTLIFGVMGVINFAHGELMMLGGMATYWLSTLYGVNPLLSLLVVMPAGMGLGALIQHVLIARIVDAPAETSLLLTFGLALFLIGLAQALWGNLFRSVPYLGGSWRVLGVSFPIMRSVAFVIAAVLTIGLWLYLQRARMGKAIRATAQHAQVAMTCGVDVGRVRRLTFGLGSAMAAAAGSLLVTIVAIHPQVGALYILKSFAIVVLGGLGSFTGALLGGLLLGLIEVFGTLYVSSAVGQASAYVVLLIVLLLRPGGLMGASVKVRA